MPTTQTAIPAEVELVRSFLTTVDVREGTEELASPDDLARWLAAARLVPKGTVASGRDLRLAHQLRTALRDDLLASADPGGGAAERASLDAACRELPLHVVADVGLAPAVTGLRAGLTAIVVAAATARIRGTWARLKVCPADGCRFAFYDTSRGRSRRWCSTEVCGAKRAPS